MDIHTNHSSSTFTMNKTTERKKEHLNITVIVFTFALYPEKNVVEIYISWISFDT